MGALFTYVHYHGMNIVFNLGILGDEKTYKYPLYWSFFSGFPIGVLKSTLSPMFMKIKVVVCIGLKPTKYRYGSNVLISKLFKIHEWNTYYVISYMCIYIYIYIVETISI